MVTMGLIIMLFGLAWIAGTIIFKSKINGYYQNVSGLDEKQKRYYQKIVVKVPGVIFFVVGLYFLLVSFPELKNLADKINWSMVLGFFALGYGLFTLLIRILKREAKFFSKYNAMIAAYGNNAGKMLHVFAYTILPIVVGFLLLFKVIVL